MQNQAELNRLRVKLDDMTSSYNNSEKALEKSKKDLSKKSEELVICQKDLKRFKELSENYMNEVTRLEALLEQNDLKPKGSQK